MQTGEPGVTHSEDCLYLNVWAPQGKGPFPVMVWIHGGGFTAGHAFEAMYDGSEFAREGIVCVTVGYRLGVLGFLDVGPLIGREYEGSANNGVRDLIAALVWVKQHIADFGGDPTRVTVAGESAGAKLTDILMGVPEAQPLFQQMISESGGAERVWSATDSATVAVAFGERWKATSGQTVAALKSADPKLLIDCQKDFIEHWPQHFPLRAEIDGKLIPRLPVETIVGGSTRGKRLLIGTNRDESALFIGAPPNRAVVAGDLGNTTFAKFEAVYPEYAKLYPAMSADELRIRAVTAEEYLVPTVRVVDAHVRGGGTAWMYRLDFAETSGRMKLQAYHSLDVGLVWDKPHADVANAALEAALAWQVHAAWVAFIRGKAPSATGLPAWPEYRSDKRLTMLLNDSSSVQAAPDEAEVRLWRNIL